MPKLHGASAFEVGMPDVPMATDERIRLATEYMELTGYTKEKVEYLFGVKLSDVSQERAPCLPEKALVAA
jgi:hypothetical protein